MRLFRAAGLPFAVWQLALGLAAQTPAGSSARLTPLPPADAGIAASSADRRLLPLHSSAVVVERTQLAHLTAPGQPELWFVPVRFDHGEPSPIDAGHVLAERSRCGVFVMGPGGTHQQFLWTIRASDSDELAVDQCGGLLAIRRIGNGPHPDIRLDYRTFAPPRFQDKVHVILSWDAKAGRYEAGSAAET